MFVFFGIVFQATGVLESLQLALAVSAPAPAKPSVKIGEALKGISFERADPATWPTSKLTDDLRDAIDSLKKKDIAKKPKGRTPVSTQSSEQMSKKNDVKKYTPSSTAFYWNDLSQSLFLERFVLELVFGTICPGSCS